MARQTPGRRFPDKKRFKAVWMIWSFVVGYIVAITGVEFDIFGEIGAQVNGIIKGVGGIGTIALGFTIYKYFAERNKEDKDG